MTAHEETLRLAAERGELGSPDQLFEAARGAAIRRRRLRLTSAFVVVVLAAGGVGLGVLSRVQRPTEVVIAGTADGDTPANADAAAGTTSTAAPRTFPVPQEAQAAYCSAADLLRDAPTQPPSEASVTFRSAAEDLDRAREQIIGTSMRDRSVKSSLGALVSTVRLALIAATTGDDTARRENEASIKTRLANHSADCA